MYLSVTDPIGRAIAYTRRLLFQPFEIGKWFTLGFCAFLAALDRGGQGWPGFDFKGVRGGGFPSGAAIKNWIQVNASWLLPTVVVSILLLLGISALLTWLGSRGKFMFLDGIACNRGAVVAPWRRFRELGNSLFAFSFVLGLIRAIVLLALMSVALWIAWPDLQANQFQQSALSASVFMALVFLPVALALWAIVLLLRDFVVPTMYLSGERVMAAWRIAGQQLLADHLGTIVVFYLMKLVLLIGIVTVTVAAACLTCCVATVPYLGTVLLLPLWVFERCYVLCFLEQYGPKWRFFRELPAQPRCLRCDYDLRFNVSGVCPECGMPISESRKS